MMHCVCSPVHSSQHFPVVAYPEFLGGVRWPHQLYCRLQKPFSRTQVAWARKISRGNTRTPSVTVWSVADCPSYHTTVMHMVCKCKVSFWHSHSKQSIHHVYNVRQGELSFERLLRVDGSFKGQLVSTGDLVIGATGVVRGNIEHLREVGFRRKYSTSCTTYTTVNSVGCYDHLGRNTPESRSSCFVFVTARPNLCVTLLMLTGFVLLHSPGRIGWYYYRQHSSRTGEASSLGYCDRRRCMPQSQYGPRCVHKR